MKIERCSVSADTLVGAIITSPRFGEVAVVGVEFDLINHEVNLVVDLLDSDRVALKWEDFKDSDINLQSPIWRA